MNMNKGILIEVDRETGNTKRLLERLNDEHLSYKPHPKSMSLGELASHIVELHNWVQKALPFDAFDFHTMYQPLKVSTVTDLIGILDDGLEQNKVTIENLSDNDWQQIWTLKAGDYVIASIPKAAAYRYILLNHIVHHRGQLTVYMRMLDIPLPGLYGPSADEKMS